MSFNRCFLAAVIAAGFVFQGAMASASWPTYRADQARSGFGRSDVSGLHWQPAWFQTSNVKPQPAWPAPAKASLWQNLESISARQREDLADVPLIVTDKQGQTQIIQASSGADFVRSLSAVDGSTRWLIPLTAPVRFAPVVENDVVYFGCDDGFVRAARLLDGSVIWESPIGPELPWIVGNGRVISPHPVRTSLLIADGHVIAHAGLFPSQGVYSVALQQDSGELVWRRRTETSPQGYLLADGNGRAIVPAGRAQPYLIDLSNGEASVTLPSPGGSFCMLTEQRVYTGPGNTNEVSVAEHDAEKRLVAFPSQAIAAGNGMIWTANGEHLTCYRETDLREGEHGPVWSTPCKLSANLILVGLPNSDLRLFAVGGREIHVFDALRGDCIQTLVVPGEKENLIHVACSANGSNAYLTATSTLGSLFVWQGVRTQIKPVLPEPDLTELDLPESAANDWNAISLPMLEQTSKELADASESETLTQLRQSIPCSVGLGLMIGIDDQAAVRQFLDSTEYQLIVIAKDRQQEQAWRHAFTESGYYGRRICVWPAEFLTNQSLQPGIFNFVAFSGDYGDRIQPQSLCAADGLLVFLPDAPVQSEGTARIVQLQQAMEGAWRHQYASPTNDADAKDPAFIGATGFRLQWFGGVGPRLIPDRHLRGAAPLVAGSSMVLHGDGWLIGVDPANGMERWQLQLPEGAMRYVIPFDSGYSCLSADGQQFYTVAKEEIWQLNPKSGEILGRIQRPDDAQGQSWGYLAEVNGDLFATLMNSDAPRFSQDRVLLRQSFVNDDYNSDRPLVCSTRVLRLNSSGTVVWERKSEGVIPNSTVTIDASGQHMLFIEGTSDTVQDRSQSRFTTAEVLKQGKLVCLNTENGQIVWQKELSWPDARNMLYVLVADNFVVATSSRSENERAIYTTKVFQLDSGDLAWQKTHTHVREGLFHGEQVHHPVAVRRPDGRTTLIVEPYMYELTTGDAFVPAGMPPDWAVSRPGHSCGTMTAAADCLFFRANNPTALNLNAQNSQERFIKLSPSRPSCWINIVPAVGRLFIPEGSASCVCQYSLQTSMAFAPINQAQYDQHWLTDVLP